MNWIWNSGFVSQSTYSQLNASYSFLPFRQQQTVKPQTASSVKKRPHGEERRLWLSCRSIHFLQRDPAVLCVLWGMVTWVWKGELGQWCFLSSLRRQKFINWQNEPQLLRWYFQEIECLCLGRENQSRLPAVRTGCSSILMLLLTPSRRVTESLVFKILAGSAMRWRQILGLCLPHALLDMWLKGTELDIFSCYSRIARPSLWGVWKTAQC